MTYFEVRRYLMENNYPVITMIENMFNGCELVFKVFIEGCINKGLTKQDIAAIFSTLLDVPKLFIFNPDLTLNINAMNFIPTRLQLENELLNANR